LFKITLAVCLVFLPALAPAAGEPRSGDQELTAAQYHAGLKTLRGYLEKRDLEPDAAERFIAVMATALPPSEGQRVPVTHDVFSAFLRYQAAWARKTRDRKNARVSPAQLAEEAARAVRLKEEFRLKASASSPVFYRVFQAAVREVRRAPRRDGKAYEGSSTVFFADQVDPSYTHVDAGDVALENGDAAGAILEANKALAINPGNADAFVLRAGAEYALRDSDAAVKDAQSALLLDPENQQAKAILSLSGMDAGRAALKTAAEGGASLADDGRRAGLPTLGGTTGEAPAAIASPSGAPSATPAVGALLSLDLTARAVGKAKADARSSIDELDRALTLDPRNGSARGWRTAILNRIGDYSSALASAEQSLTLAPDDAPAYFHKAYALAGAGDKAGTLDALRQAARRDPAYQPVLDRTLQLPGPEDMMLAFGEFAESHQPELPPARRARYPLPLLSLGVLGGLLALAGVAQLFRKGR
jgi:tetratricopeptide (TPR) repeat protein